MMWVAIAFVAIVLVAVVRNGEFWTPPFGYVVTREDSPLLYWALIGVVATAWFTLLVLKSLVQLGVKL